MTYREQEVSQEADRSVLVAGLNGKVFGLDRETGETLWKNGLPGGGMNEVFIALRYGVLAVSAGGSKVYRLDYLTGNTLWDSDTTSVGRATILIEVNCIVVAKGGYIDTFDHAGNKLWKQPLKRMGMGEVSLGFPGNIAQADNAGS